MDEPFGAIDPITRARLQDEFLRLQAEVRKTIVFVTHDVEEAVRMGDRIVILAEGGHLAQYDTPANILGHPASPFVADFVGADRGLKRLSVTPITLEHLEPAVGAVADPRSVQLGSSLKDALAELLQDDDGSVTVVDGDQVVGILTPASLHRALRDDVRLEAGESGADDLDVAHVRPQ
jgi:osmoprotectant transport system ATP-binding protein